MKQTFPSGGSSVILCAILLLLMLLLLCTGCVQPTYEHVGCELERGDIVVLPGGSRGIVDRISYREKDEWNIYVLCKHRECCFPEDMLTLECKFDFDNDPTYKIEWRDCEDGHLLEPPKFIPPPLPPAKTPCLPTNKMRLCYNV